MYTYSSTIQILNSTDAYIKQNNKLSLPPSIHIHPSLPSNLNNETDLPSPKSSSIPSMACACHKCIWVISISIFSACLFKTPYFDCYNKFYIIKYSLWNHFIKKKNLYQFFYFTYKRHLNYHTPSRFLSRYIWLKYFWFFITHLFGKYFSSEILNQSNNPEIITSTLYWSQGSTIMR